MRAEKEIDWGGSAFPTEGGLDSGLYPDPGMSLRDYIAIHAMAGSLAGEPAPISCRIDWRGILTILLTRCSAPATHPSPSQDRRKAMGEPHLIQRCMTALHAKYVLSDDEARGMADVVLSTAQTVAPHTRCEMAYLHRLKGSEDWNISLPCGMATAWEYQKLYPSNIEIVPLYTEAGTADLSRVGYQELFKAIGDAVTVQPDGKSLSISVKAFRTSVAEAKDDENKSSEETARWVIDQWRTSCAVELIPSVDVLEGIIAATLASHTSALAERDAEIGRLREALAQISEMASWQTSVPTDTEAANEHARIAAGMSDVARAALSPVSGTEKEA